MAVGSVQGVKQDKSQATKAPKLTKEHGLIVWSRPARDVCNQIRAMQPWPTAYSFWHSGVDRAEPIRLIVYRAQPAESSISQLGSSKAPAIGDVLSPNDSSHLVVAAGDQTALEILELQPAGKRRMLAAEYLRGHHPKPGDHLGTAAS
jgi:methionyl-tRNA formyltransferase